MEDFTSFVLILLFIAFVIWLAVLPALIAKKKESVNQNYIIGLTILGMFIPLCWLVALVWSLLEKGTQPQKVILVKEQ